MQTEAVTLPAKPQILKSHGLHFSTAGKQKWTNASGFSSQQETFLCGELGGADKPLRCQLGGKKQSNQYIVNYQFNVDKHGGGRGQPGGGMSSGTDGRTPPKIRNDFFLQTFVDDKFLRTFLFYGIFTVRLGYLYGVRAPTPTKHLVHFQSLWFQTADSSKIR